MSEQFNFMTPELEAAWDYLKERRADSAERVSLELEREGLIAYDSFADFTPDHLKDEPTYAVQLGSNGLPPISEPLVDSFFSPDN